MKFTFLFFKFFLKLYIDNSELSKAIIFFTPCCKSCLQISDPIVPPAPVTIIFLLNNFFIFLILICFLFKIIFISSIFKSLILI